jgi:hypothetical protein
LQQLGKEQASAVMRAVIDAAKNAQKNKKTEKSPYKYNINNKRN